jgi:transcription elongation factor Elf1
VQAGCPVCGSAKLASDEVFVAGGTMRLVECLHCDHRFTSRPRSRWSELGARIASGDASSKRGRRGRLDPADPLRVVGRERWARRPAMGAEPLGVGA